MKKPVNDETHPDHLNDPATQDPVVLEKLVDAQTPGFQAEFDPDEAQLLGAFFEDALSETDALESCIDQPQFTAGGH
ncbi:conjugal transfer protein TraD [Nitrosomonas aestuarii]|uniref:conjugal transfer protein TraD n=1 Tax=Nitrosomonas aestuarii TaxID=52441 RepID=UPI000D312430|nr:conjugal transfer protein TraD [Nitrosomonas aestuarii]PTN12445.1 hypothetical protein C8R11_1038 [Nitrosomonas aestuarii]